MKQFCFIMLFASSLLYSQNRLAPFKDILPNNIFQYPKIVEHELTALKEDITLNPDLVYYRIMTRVAIHDNQINKDSLEERYNYVKNQAYAKRADWASANLENFGEKYPGYEYMFFVENLYKNLSAYEKLTGTAKPAGPGKDTLNLFAARYINSRKVSAAEAEIVLSEASKKKRKEIENIYVNMNDDNVTSINLTKFLRDNWLIFDNAPGVSANEFIYRYFENLYSSSYYGQFIVGAGPTYYIGGDPIDIKYTFDNINSDVTIFDTELTQTLSLSVGYNFFLSKYREAFSYITAEIGAGYVILPNEKNPQLLYSSIEKKNGHNINTMLFLREAEVKNSHIITTNLRVSTPFYYLTRNLVIEAGASIYLNTIFYSFMSVRDYESINLETLEIEPHGMTEGRFTENKTQTWFEPRPYLALSYYFHQNLVATLAFNGSILGLRGAIIL